MSIFANSEDPDEMQNNAAFLVKEKKIFGQKNTFKKNNLTLPDLCNELSRVYRIKPEGRIHLYTKG